MTDHKKEPHKFASMSEARRFAHTNPGLMAERFRELRLAYDELLADLTHERARSAKLVEAVERVFEALRTGGDSEKGRALIYLGIALGAFKRGD